MGLMRRGIYSSSSCSLSRALFLVQGGTETSKKATYPFTLGTHIRPLCSSVPLLVNRATIGSFSLSLSLFLTLHIRILYTRVDIYTKTNTSSLRWKQLRIWVASVGCGSANNT